MGYFILHYYMDLGAFVILGLLAAWRMGHWVHRSTQVSRGGLSGRAWALVLAVTAATVLLALDAGRRESDRLKEIVSGFAPTYAGELARMGHAKMSVQTPPDDPAYLAMIDAQIRWEKENPWIADIYTFGKSPDGKTVLLVDSETDYDHNGKFQGEREQRTPIGEVYDEDPDLLAQAFAGQPVFTPSPTSDRWGQWMSTYVPMTDDHGKVIAVLGVDYPAATWIHSILWYRGAILVLGSLVLAVLIGSLGVTTVLHSEIQRRRQSESAREEMQNRLLVASRRAGMAEIATEVLHNVGNALNSVNVSAGVIADKLRQTDIGGLSDAAQALRAHDADLPQFLASDSLGRQLPHFLATLAESIEDDHKVLGHELEHLTRGIDHIKAIVRSQQELARDTTVLTAESPGQLMAEALKFHAPLIQQQAIQVDCAADACGTVMLDKHKVLQILVNLISNAIHAVQDVDSSRRRIQLVVKGDPHALTGETSALEFQVTDSGIGIPPENLARIFQHGFTTRPEGHGFGLHSAANAASEMGGRLLAHSDGVGLGARFVLQLHVSTAAAVTECHS